MYGIYCTEAWGREAHEGWACNKMPYIPSARDITILYPVGITTIDTHRTVEKKKEEISFYHMPNTLNNSIPIENVHCLIHFLL